VYEDYSLNAPRPTYLGVLTRLNVLNSLAKNAAAMGFPVEGLCRDEFVSPYNQLGPSITPIHSCPNSLRPTELQRTIKHHPWIDLFPIARMRDNMLQGLVLGVLDEDDLCADLLNVEDDTQGEKAALIVWGEPWDVWSWEASVAFLKKWTWLIHGCPEILEVTNYWREKRGETRLAFSTPWY